MDADIDLGKNVEVTREMEIAGAEALIAHLSIGGMDFARDVAREVFLAMRDKISKSRD